MWKLIFYLFSLMIIGVFIIDQYSYGSDKFYLVKIDLETREDLIKLKSTAFTAFAKISGSVLGAADQSILEQFKEKALVYTILDQNPYSHYYYFAWYRGKESLSQALKLVRERGRILYQEGNMFLVSGEPEEIKELSGHKMKLKRIFQIPLPLEIPEPEPELYKAPAYSTVIADMISQVNTEEILDYVKDLSGERSVEIGGVPDSIPTRYTGTQSNLKAAQYLQEQFEQMGLEVVPDTFYIPFDGNLSDVKAARDGQTAWLCTNHRGILRTTDGGGYWYSVAGTEQFELIKLFRLTDDTLWSVGFEGLVINSTDEGISWAEKTRPTTKGLLGVYFENNSSGWVVGNLGEIYYTSDGGVSWVSQASGTTQPLWDITFSEPDNGWVVGGNGVLLHTTDGGLNWQSVYAATDRTLYDIEFVTPLKGWAVGASGTVRYTTDGGVSWFSKSVGTTGDIDALCFAPEDTLKGWMVSFGRRLIFRTQDGGETWSAKSTFANFSSIDFANSQTGWTAGRLGLAHTTDGGENWNSQFENIIVGNPNINVIATLPGEIRPDFEFLISAHYDDYSEIPEVYAPGADDDASGTALVLEAASIMKDYKFVNTIKFICFAVEEQGMIGSEIYVDKAWSKGADIKGVLNFDMIAYDGNQDGQISILTDSNSLNLTDLFISIISEYGLGLNSQKVFDVYYCDHAPFWNYNYRAITGHEDYDDFNPYYHTTAERISAFDTTYFRKHCQAGLATFATLATPCLNLRGDFNSDQTISVSDVVFLINYLFKGGQAPSPPFLADVNCSGEVDISDVIYLINYVFKGGPLPGDGNDDGIPDC